MGNVSRFSGSYAKVCAMKGRMLTRSDYDMLFDCKSVLDIASVLKKTKGYGKLFLDLDEKVDDIITLEKVLSHAADRDLIKLRHFMNSDGKRFMAFLVMKKEIEVLKQILRCINSKTEFVPDFYDGGYLYSNFSFDVQALAESKNIYDFVELLRDTYYYPIVSRLDENTSFGIFRAEMILDKFYYTKLWQLCKRALSGKDKESVTSAIGRNIDVMNILWILRCRLYFNVSDEIIYEYLLPINYKVKYDVIQDMVKARTVDELFEIISTTKYADIFADRNGDYEQLWADTAIKRESKDSKLNPFSVFAVIEYCNEKETEIKNIIRIAEAIQYDVDKSEIKNYITMKGGILNGR